jgi:hypothetical protein
MQDAFIRLPSQAWMFFVCIRKDQRSGSSSIAECVPDKCSDLAESASDVHPSGILAV